MWRELVKQTVPTKRLGVVSPLDVIDTSVYEFYRVARSDVIMSTISIGLTDFSSDAAHRAVEDNLARCVKELSQRNVDYISLNGIPLLLHMGTDYSRQFREWCEGTYGIPAGTSVDAAVAALRALKVHHVVTLNKWSEGHNEVLKEIFQAHGVNIVGNVSNLHTADEVKTEYEKGIDVALDLVEDAIAKYPDTDCLYLAGGAWLVLPLIAPIEERFGVPVVAGQQSKIWHSLSQIGAFEPVEGYGTLLSMKSPDA